MNQMQNLNLLHMYSNIIDKAADSQQLNTLCGMVLHKLRVCKIESINRMVLDNLCLTLSSKLLLMLNLGIALGSEVIELIEFMKNGECLNKTFLGFFSLLVDRFHAFVQKEAGNKIKTGKLDSGPNNPGRGSDSLNEGVTVKMLNGSIKVERDPNYGKSGVTRPLKPSERRFQDGRYEMGLKESLDVLLNIEDKAEKYISKRFGYALLEKNGDFVWADRKTREKLNFTESDLKQVGKNLFDLMIPFSKFYLKSKFGRSLFPSDAGVGFTRAFSYVIYSASSVRKLTKELKNKGYSNVDQASIIKSKDDKEKEIFYRFLSNISSRATLVLVSFSEAEIESVLQNPRTEIKSQTGLSGGQGTKPTSQLPTISISALKTLQGHFQEFKNPKVKFSPNSYFQIDDGKELVKIHVKPNGELEMLKMFILLETRPAGHVPSFDFTAMENDPCILKFKRDINSRLEKIISRKNRKHDIVKKKQRRERHQTKRKNKMKRKKLSNMGPNNETLDDGKKETEWDTKVGRSLAEALKPQTLELPLIKKAKNRVLISDAIKDILFMKSAVKEIKREETKEPKTEDKKKRKRGRPRKNPVPAKSVKVAKKKKRGRKKKMANLKKQDVQSGGKKKLLGKREDTDFNTPKS